MTGPQAVLAGGPEHGRRLGISRPCPAYIHLESQAWRPALLAQPPRPARWRHPLAWRRWRPVAASPVPAPVSCVYRHSGFLGDDTPVYWYGGPDTAPPADPAEVLRYLYRALDEAPPQVRMSPGAHWEMGPEWYTAIRAASASCLLEPVPSGPDRALYGNSVKVTFGSPRLVTRETP